MSNGTFSLANSDPVIASSEGSIVQVEKDGNNAFDKVGVPLKLVLSCKYEVRNLYLHYLAEVLRSRLTFKSIGYHEMFWFYSFILSSL